MTYEPNYSKAYRDSSLHNSHSYYMGLGRHAHRTLKSILQYLPKVGPDGSSDSPTAELMYRQKNEAEQNAREVVGQLKGMLNVIKNEVQRSRTTIAKMDRANTTLHGKKVKAHLSKTVQAEAAHLKNAVKQGQELEQIVRSLDDLLIESQSKNFPGMKAPVNAKNEGTQKGDKPVKKSNA